MAGACIAALMAGCGAGKTKTVTVSAHPSTPSAPPFTRLIATDETGVIRIEASTCEGKDIGTGFVITPQLVATVDHVVADATLIDLKQNGVLVATGKVIGDDPTRDVALVEASKPIDGHIFKLASRSPEVGENVAAIGFPLGLPLTVTKGSVSGLHRTIPIDGIERAHLVQTDAAVNPGNSGGPLISQEDGEVIGLVDLGTNEANGTAFAVSAEVAAPLLAAWRTAPQTPATPACSPPREAPPTVEASATSEVETIRRTLERHYSDVEEENYAEAWQDFTLVEANRLGGEETWIRGNKAVAPQHFTINVAPELTSATTAVASVLEFKTEAANGCQEWTGHWSMVRANGAWKIGLADLSPSGCT